jgi:hypothetical protein
MKLHVAQQYFFISIIMVSVAGELLENVSERKLSFALQQH